jgi:RNA polymerase sigma-70 factor (ECF subfamily)
VTTQPELPESAALPARPLLRLAPVPAEPDVDFDGFVRSYEARLRRLVMRRIGDLCEAEEITQETLLRAYQHRASFSSEDELMAWSTVVAQRLVIDRVRVRGRSIAVAEVPESARLGRDTAEIVVARHEARAALESLEAIPTRQAAILWAREVEGLHYEEIAERFGITEPAVRSLLHRGRKALRKEFKDRTGSLPLNGLVPFAPWLLALKAAGKVRGAAKTLGRSPAAAVAALSLTGIFALGTGGAFTGYLPGRDVSIRPAQGGATLVRPVGNPVGAVEKGGTSGSPRAYGLSATGSAIGATPTHVMPNTRSCASSHDGYGACVTTVPHYTWRKNAIVIDPNLPPNPAHQGAVVVDSDKVDCAKTGLPGTGPVRCGSSHDADPKPNDSSPSPSTEGALR